MLRALIEVHLRERFPSFRPAIFDHLSPGGERLRELLFGLIMTLTFTLGASIAVGDSEGASTSLLYATLGCSSRRSRLRSAADARRRNSRQWVRFDERC